MDRLVCRGKKSAIRLAVLFSLLPLLAVLCSSAGAASGISLAATDVTLNAASGIEVPSNVTFRSLDGYSGTLVWACGPASDPAPAYSPTCTVFPETPLTLTANASATRTVWLVPYGFAAPLVRKAGFGPVFGLAFSVLLTLPMLRSRLRWRAWRALILLPATMGICAGVSACGGSSRHTGSFAMVVEAQDANAPQVSARATFTATVK